MDIRKCFFSPMPFPQISQVLCISGVLGALYLPDSTSSGRRPHLNIAIFVGGYTVNIRLWS